MRHIILSIFILPFYLGLNAQELATEKATDTIPEGISVDEVQVVKAFEANLKKARNYDVKPEIPTIPVTHPNYKYKLTLTPIKIDYPEPQLRPLAMKPDDPFDVNRFYAKLGYGTIQNPWVDISYSDVQKESHYFGIGAHYDAADQSKKYLYKKHQNLGLGLSGGLMALGENMLYLDMGVEQKKRFYYQGPSWQDSIFSEESSKRNINAFNLNLGLKNNSKEMLQTSYALNLSFNKTKASNPEISGTTIGLAGELNHGINRNLQLGIDINAGFEESNFGRTTDDLFSFDITPNIVFTNKKINISGGVFIAKDSDKSKIFPKINGLVNLKNGLVNIIFGTDAKRHSNNISNLLKSNPWVGSSSDSLYNNYTEDIYAGFRGANSYLQYELRMGFKKITNYYYFINDPNDFRQFSLLHEPKLRSNYFDVYVDIALTDVIHVGGNLDLNFMKSTIVDKPLHISENHITTFALIKLYNEKLLIKPFFIVKTAPYYRDLLGNILQNRRQAELNIELNYNFSENFGVNLSAMNILDKDYEDYYNYSNYGINFAGGLMVKF